MNKFEEINIINLIIQNPEISTSDIINNVNLDGISDINKFYQDIEILKKTPIVLLVDLKKELEQL